MKLFLTSEEDAKIRKEFTEGGRGYGSFKEELHQKIMAFLTPIQERFNKITDKDIEDILTESTAKMNEIAKKKIDEVFRKVGFYL